MTPLKRGMRPKQAEHIGKFYTLSEVEHLLSCVKGDGTEFPVLMAAFYGLRRSEIMGLKWDSIDFDANTITIAHVVVEVSIDGKDTIVAKDRPKNKKSYRTLPLVPEYRRLLLQMKKHQEEYRELCGNCYHESDYIYVNDLGEPIRPNYVSQHFKLVLKNNNLREITFHELRHTCASLLLKSGISMKFRRGWGIAITIQLQISTPIWSQARRKSQAMRCRTILPSVQTLQQEKLCKSEKRG